MKLTKWILALSILSAAPSIGSAIQIGDNDGNPEMVSLDDYEGETAHAWRHDESLRFSERLYREFLFRSLKFLSEHMRWPNDSEAPQILRAAKKSVFTKEDLEPVENEDGEAIVPPVEVEEDNVNENEDPIAVNGWGVNDVLANRENIMQDVRRLFTNRYLYIRRKIASAYIRGILQSDLPKEYRTGPTNPSEDLFYFAMIKSKTNGGPKLFLDVVQSKFNMDFLRDLYQPGRPSVERTGPFPQPLIFAGGELELESAARFDAPYAFRYFKKREYTQMERAQATLAAIENSTGFIATSWTNGKKDISQDFLDAIINKLEENDWVLLVGPTQQNFEGLPEIFLNHPRIHVVTHTIENSALKISNEQLNPDTEDPIPQLTKPGRTDSDKNIIAFHTHQRIVTVAVAEGGSRPVVVATTGSINEAFASYSGLSQGARKEANKTFHEIAALIMEKASDVIQYDSDGLENVWLPPRGIEYYDDRAFFDYTGQAAQDFNGSSGFIDLGEAYQFRYNPDGKGRRFEKRHVEPQYELFADPHIPETDSRYEASIVNDQNFTEDTEVDFLAGDSLDNGEISHWLMDQRISMNKRVQKGSIFALDAVNAMINARNALLQRYPKARYGMIIGNHEEWLSRLLNKTPQFHDLVNGDFLDELNFAVKALGFDVWDWIFNQREKILGDMMVRFPEKRHEIMSRVKPIYAPERTFILARGKPLYAGPEHRQVMLPKHGDMATFGKKIPSLKDHAKSSPAGGSATGHTHRPGKYKKSIDAGGGPDPDDVEYGKGYDSGVGQGLAPIYANGSKQLYIFSRRAETYRQLDPKKVPAPDKFFGEDRLRIIPNDNDLIDKDGAGLQYAREQLKTICDQVLVNGF